MTRLRCRLRLCSREHRTAPIARGPAFLVQLFLGVVCGLYSATVQAAPPEPPKSLQAVDHPTDDGTAIDLTWELAPGDLTRQPAGSVTRYRIERQEAAAAHGASASRNANHNTGPSFEKVAEVPAGTIAFTDNRCLPNAGYLYRISALNEQGTASEFRTLTEPVIARRQWFDGQQVWFGGLLCAVCCAVLLYIRAAERGAPLHLRPIAGLQAVDEAVGRATEMGRKCLFIPGIQDLNDIQTIAGLTVLARVAATAADYDCPVEVPTSRSLVMTAARETQQAAALAAGRPEMYREELSYYISDEQFAYVAAVTGMMIREKPAACFYMGAFYAESLILAETGNSIGAIQIGGTAESSQLPFFVAACDYVLIGEEFFAASAYLSREPRQLGTLKGQDVGKLMGAGLIVLGVLAVTCAALFPRSLLFAGISSFLKQTVLQ